MKVLLIAAAVLLLSPSVLLARQAYNGNCEQGGKVATVGGLTVTPDVMGSYPQCTVTVYGNGTIVLSTLYSDNSGTPLANPFTAHTDGSFQFYAANGRYDVVNSGGGLGSPVTIFDVLLSDGGGGGSGTVTSIAMTVPTQLAIAGTPITTSGTLALTLNSPQGNGAKLQLSTGSTTTNDCVKFDVNGNTVDAGSACGSGGGSGTVTSVGNVNLANFSNCTVSNPTTTPTWSCAVVVHGNLATMTDITLPTIIFGGATISSAQGNAGKMQLSTGSTTTNDCLVYDSSGNAIDGGGTCGIGTYINQFPTTAMKGTFLSAQFYNAVNTQSGSAPLWFTGTGSFGTCTSNENDYFLPISGWTRNLTFTLASTMGDGQQSVITPYVNCIFNGIAGSGLTIPPSATTGSYYTQAGLYRIEQLDKVEFNLGHKSTGASGSTLAPYGTSGTVGMEFVADQQVTGTGGPISIFGSFGSLTPSNTTSYAGPGNLNTTNPTVEGAMAMPIPVAGTVKLFTGSMQTANSSTGTTTIKVRKNLADSAIVITVNPVTGSTDNNGRVGSHIDGSNSFSVVAGDTVDYKLLQSDGSTAGAFSNLMLGFEPTNGTSALVWGSMNLCSYFVNENAGTYYLNPFSGYCDTVESHVRYTLPRGGVASKLYIYVSPLSSGADIDTFTLERWDHVGLSLIDTPITCTASPADIGVLVCDITHSATYLKQDGISLKAVVGANSGGTVQFAGWDLAFD